VNLYGTGEPRSIEYAVPAATAREIGWQLLELAGAIDHVKPALND
jgi:hypothetical protein